MEMEQVVTVEYHHRHGNNNNNNGTRISSSGNTNNNRGGGGAHQTHFYPRSTTGPNQNLSSRVRITHQDEVAIVDLIQFQPSYSSLQRPLRHVSFNSGDGQRESMQLSDYTNRFNEVLEASFNEATPRVPTGLSEQQIPSCLNTRIHQAHQHTELCIICQDGYRVHQKIGTLHCKHEYHEDCIKQWLSVSTVCPICRRAALVDEKRS